MSQSFGMSCCEDKVQHMLKKCLRIWGCLERSLCELYIVAHWEECRTDCTVCPLATSLDVSACLPGKAWSQWPCMLPNASLFPNEYSIQEQEHSKCQAIPKQNYLVKTEQGMFNFTRMSIQAHMHFDKVPVQALHQEV